MPKTNEVCPKCGCSFIRIRQYENGSKMYVHSEYEGMPGFVIKSCHVTENEEVVANAAFAAFAAIYSLT